MLRLRSGSFTLRRAIFTWSTVTGGAPEASGACVCSLIADPSLDLRNITRTGMMYKRAAHPCAARCCFVHCAAHHAEDFFAVAAFVGGLGATFFAAGRTAAFFTVGFFAFDEVRLVVDFLALLLFDVERRDEALPRFERAVTVGRF